MTSWAKPGVKVVRINGPAPSNYQPAPARKLKRGSVFTIRKVLSDPMRPEIIGVYLEEVTNDLHPVYGLEYGYLLTDFRPLITKTQEEDVAMFKRIASEAPFHVLVDEKLGLSH